jgi:methyltransferase family protein
MHPAIFAAFDDICRRQSASGPVLEIGATATSDTLLMLPSLAGLRERVGVNIVPPSEIGGCPIVQCNAHDLSRFETGHFATILCNSMLEHDPQFWLTLAEIRRVARSGALIGIGVPGFAPAAPGRMRNLLNRLRRLPTPWRPEIESHLAGTPVLPPHDFPGDYYRFSEQACREVLMAGLELIEIHRLLDPPRFVAAGRVP